jgi:hypothetical protein
VYRTIVTLGMAVSFMGVAHDALTDASLDARRAAKDSDVENIFATGESFAADATSSSAGWNRDSLWPVR